MTSNNLFSYWIGTFLLLILSVPTQAQTILATQDFDGGSPTWNYDSSIDFFDGDTLAFYGPTATFDSLDFADFDQRIFYAHNIFPASLNNIDTFAILTFDAIDVSSFTNVNLSFDYDLEGYAGPEDVVEYEVFYGPNNTMSQGVVTIFDGNNGTATEQEGQVNIAIPDMVTTVSIRLYIRNEGEDAYAGFDNFLLTGNSMLPIVRFTQDTSQVLEGDAATVQHTVRVFMDRQPSSDLTVDINSVPGTAMANLDYTTFSGSVTFLTTSTFPDTQQVVVDILPDLLLEGNEEFSLLLTPTGSSASQLVITPSTHTVTIRDNDLQTANPGDIVINEVMANPDCESDTDVEFIELFNTTNQTINILGWTLADNNGEHSFLPINGATAIAPGDVLLCAVSNGTDYFDPGRMPDYVYGNDISLSNGRDSISLHDGNQLICSVSFPNTDLFGEGVSAQLPGNFNYAKADDGRLEPADFKAGESPFGCSDLGTPGGMNILPVVLLSFNGEAMDRGNKLRWQTASEENNAYFTVERSSTGRDFTKIGQVVGNGTTQQAVEYAFMDEAGQSAYYRLVQVDFDGTSEVFGPIFIKNDQTHTPKISVWPVPAAEQLHWQFTTERLDNNWRLEIINAYGQTVLRQAITNTQDQLDIRTLEAGIYLLVATDGQQRITQALVKQ
ncbi:MAG: lamin tail domain-containing protein [Bacteroidota bacterium]